MWPAASWPRQYQLVDAVRIADREGPQHVGVEHGEEHRDEAQADGQGEHRGGRERAAAPESAPGVGHVAAELFEGRFPSGVAHVVLHRGAATQPQARCAGGVLARESATPLVLGRCLEELLQLVVEVPVGVPPAHQRRDSREEPVQRPHQISSGIARRMRSIAAVCSSQSRVSRRSVARPAAVSA